MIKAVLPEGLAPGTSPQLCGKSAGALKVTKHTFCRQGVCIVHKDLHQLAQWQPECLVTGLISRQAHAISGRYASATLRKCYAPFRRPLTPSDEAYRPKLTEPARTVHVTNPGSEPVRNLGSAEPPLRLVQLCCAWSCSMSTVQVAASALGCFWRPAGTSFNIMLHSTNNSGDIQWRRAGVLRACKN